MKLEVRIERAKSTIDVFEVDFFEGMTVLNILEEIYRYHDPSVSFRFSCRTGLCTTCMMMINGKPELSCMKVVKANRNHSLTLAPLPKGETVKDLVKEL